MGPKLEIGLLKYTSEQQANATALLQHASAVSIKWSKYILYTPRSKTCKTFNVRTEPFTGQVEGLSLDKHFQVQF